VGTSPGCGEVTPLVGTSPAEMEAESTNAKAILAKNRFIILFAPLGEDARFLVSKETKSISG
jgi:hypothetical protein